MPTSEFGPFTEAQGAVDVVLGFEENFEWHEVTVSIFDQNGDPATTGVTGTLTGRVLKRGADRLEPFDTTLALASDQRAWDPELSRAEEFQLEVAGLNANYTYRITVNSWGGV